MKIMRADGAPSALFLFARLKPMLSAMLKTERLDLRPLVESDADRIVTLLNNWEVVSMLARVPYPFTSVDAENFLKRIKCRKIPVADTDYAIDKDGELIGVISISPGARGPNLGYWLGQPYWRQGFMSEAAGVLVASYFEHAEFDCLYSGVFQGNDGSMAVQRKYGFEVVGRSRVNCVSRGKEVDHIDTELTRQRYEELKA